MNKIGLIIKREYLTRVRKRSFIIMTFLGPLLLAAIYIVPILLAINASNENEKCTIAVVDGSHWFESQFKGNDEQTFIIVEGQPIDTVKEMVKQGAFDMVLYVPPTQLNIPSNAVLYSLNQVPLSTDEYIRSVMKKEIEEVIAGGEDA